MMRGLRQFGSVIFLWMTTGMVGFAQIPGFGQGQGAPQEEKYPHPESIDALPAIVEPLAWWVIALLILGGLLLLALLIWLVMKDRPQRAAPKPPALKIALAKLGKLKERSSEVPPAEAAHQVSVILREYLLGRYGIPAPYRATEEIYREGKFQANTALRERLEPLAALHDRLAFAPQPSTREEAEALIGDSVKVLEQEDSDKVYEKHFLLKERQEIAAAGAGQAGAVSGLTVRGYYFIMVWVFAIAAAVMLFLPMINKVDKIEWWHGVLFTLPWLVLAGLSYHKATKTDPRQREFLLSPDASVAEQRRFYITGLWVVPLVLGVFTFFVVRQLNLLEHGTAESVRVWAPVALAYRFIGYWGGVMVLPVVAAISMVQNAVKLSMLKTAPPRS